MRETYDIVIIGGGHNGLVAAGELARAGRSVCVVEAREQAGGCAITTQPLLPGFRHSPHANSFVFADVMPQRIAPSQLAVGSIQPEAQLGVAFADGRPPVILHRPDRLAATRASLAVYSQKDAANYAELKRRSAKMGTVLRQGLYAPPDTAWFERQRRAVLQAYGPFCDRGQLGRGNARQLVDGIFAAPEIRILLYMLAVETGVGLDDPGSDLAFLGFSLWVAGRWRIPTGGMQVYCDALLEAARKSGAQTFLSTSVERVIVEQGRATGIRTANDRQIDASQGIVAALPILSLFDSLLTPDQISLSEQAELDAFRRGALSSIGTSAFCLDREPRYKSGRHDPQIDRCLKTIIGFETPADVIEHISHVQQGLLPRPGGTVRVHSLWDQTLAPPGHHIAAVDSSFPAISRMPGENWAMVKQAFPAALHDSWRRYLVDDLPAPPMTMTLDDTLGFERRMLIRPGDAQYRTGIDGLYLAGPGVYPGGGVHGACGHNAAAVLLKDRHR